MDLYFNLNDGAITLLRDQHGTEVQPITIAGGTNVPHRVQSHRDGVPEKFPTASDVRLLVTALANFADGPLLTSADPTAWTEPLTADGYYTATLATDTDRIRTALGVDDVTGNDVGLIPSTNAQISYQPPGADKPIYGRLYHYAIEGWLAGGTTSDPVVADPTYPAADTLVSRAMLVELIGLRKSASVAIPSGQSYVDVTFASAFTDDTWEFQGLIVKKLSGTPGNILPGLVSAKTAAGFRVQLTGDTDATGYTLDYVVATTAIGGITGYTLFAEAPTDGNVYGREGDTATWVRCATHAELTTLSGTVTALAASAVDASNLTTGTLPNGRFPSVLPSLDGTALKVLTAGTAPGFSTGAAPNNFYGAAGGVWMGEPDAWGTTVVGATTYRVPLFL